MHRMHNYRKSYIANVFSSRAHTSVIGWYLWFFRLVLCRLHFTYLLNRFTFCCFRRARSSSFLDVLALSFSILPVIFLFVGIPSVYLRCAIASISSFVSLCFWWFYFCFSPRGEMHLFCNKLPSCVIYLQFSHNISSFIDALYLTHTHRQPHKIVHIHFNEPIVNINVIICWFISFIMWSAIVGWKFICLYLLFSSIQSICLEVQFFIVRWLRCELNLSAAK